MIGALPFLLKKQATDEIYRVYITDALRLMCENTANCVSGRYPQERYYDLVRPRKVETRTEEEIIADVFERGWGVKN